MGIVLFGNGFPVAGSTISFDPKFPARWARVGTTIASVEMPAELALRCRELSQPPKKNVLFFLIAPPMLAPNWF